MDLLNEFIYPIGISILFLILYPLKHKIINKIKNNQTKTLLLEFVSNFKVKINNYRLTILLPITLIVIFYFFLIIILNVNLDLFTDYSIAKRITSVIFNPISEEVLTKGILLGWIFISTPKLIFRRLRKKENKILFISIMLIGLIIQAYVFTLFHDNPTIGSFYLRLFSGLMYGIIYLSFKRNLLPSIVAHATNNLFLHYLMLIIKI